MGDSLKIVELSELPDLVIWLILEHLSYEDLQNLRATCKKLKVIINQRPFRSLHLLVKGYPCERELFYTGELVDYANTYHVSDLRLLKSIKFQSQFSELRKLTIYQTIGRKISSEIVDLNDLNCFKGLVHLQIDYVKHIENSRLSLRNLKVAQFQVLQSPDVPFELDCPRLEALGLGVRIQPQLTLETSKSVRHLFVRYAEESETYLMILYGKLKNLSTISFGSDSDLNSFVLALMEGRVCLPSLKKINLENADFFSDRGVLLPNLVKMQNRHDTRHYEVLINWKAIASDQLIEMLNLLYKFPDRRIRDPGEVDISFFWNPLYWERIRYFTENPIFNCLLPDVSDLRLETNEEFTAGKQLIGKLRNLQFLTIGKVIKLDDQFFEHILRTCPRLCSFNIGCAFPNQQLLTRMPNYLHALDSLTFRHNFSPSNLNLDFVAKFRNLEMIGLDFNIDKETMNLLFQNCNYQPVFKLYLYKQDDRDHCILSIGRKMNGQYKITRYIGVSKKKMEFDYMEDAIEHYYQNDLYNHPDRSWPVSWIRCCLM